MEFYRIVYYVVKEKSDLPDAKQLVQCIEQELEKLRAKEEEGSLIPLHYAVRALKEKLPHPPEQGEFATQIAKIRSLLTKVEKYLEGPGRDTGGQIKENISEIMDRLSSV